MGILNSGNESPLGASRWWLSPFRICVYANYHYGFAQKYQISNFPFSDKNFSKKE